LLLKYCELRYRWTIQVQVTDLIKNTVFWGEFCDAAYRISNSPDKTGPQFHVYKLLSVTSILHFKQTHQHRCYKEVIVTINRINVTYYERMWTPEKKVEWLNSVWFMTYGILLIVTIWTVCCGGRIVAKLYYILVYMLLRGYSTCHVYFKVMFNKLLHCITFGVTR